MKGSSVNNIKLDPEKQKIVECEACGVALVVGKFAKKSQTCVTAKQFPSNSKCKPQPAKTKSAREKISKTKEDNKVRSIESAPKKKQQKAPATSYGAKFIDMMNQLGFEPDAQRRFRKKYAIDGGGIATIYPQVEQQVGGQSKKVEYFSIIIQRAVGVNEDFRKFMPPDAATECELIASELGEQVITRPDVGTVKCDDCGAITDEFAVDPSKDKVLCVRPNGCFKKAFTNAGAEAEV